MQYKIIKVNFPKCEEGRFYRTYAVRPDMNLKDFGCAILTSLYSTVSKSYYFSKGSVRYLPQHMIRKSHDSEDKLITDYTVDELGEDFGFSYGIDEYSFDCSVLDLEEKDSLTDIILLDGKGQGIWEDCHLTFMAFLNGRVDSSKLEENCSENIFVPKNVKLSKYSDFDTSFDLYTMQECFYGLYTIRLELLENKKEESLYVDILNKVVDYQRNINGFVEDTYNRLIKKYSHEDVYSMIYTVLLDLAVGAAEIEEEMDIEKYKEILFKLK